MPAAAVIPAPIAYIKVVAVKKLVVESVCHAVGSSLAMLTGMIVGRPTGGLSLSGRSNLNPIAVLLIECRGGPVRLL